MTTIITPQYIWVSAKRACLFDRRPLMNLCSTLDKNSNFLAFAYKEMCLLYKEICSSSPVGKSARQSWIPACTAGNSALSCSTGIQPCRALFLTGKSKFPCTQGTFPCTQKYKKFHFWPSANWNVPVPLHGSPWMTACNTWSLMHKHPGISLERCYLVNCVLFGNFCECKYTYSTLIPLDNKSSTISMFVFSLGHVGHTY